MSSLDINRPAVFLEGRGKMEGVQEGDDRLRFEGPTMELTIDSSGTTGSRRSTTLLHSVCLRQGLFEKRINENDRVELNEGKKWNIKNVA
jgi:hypothetical protein